jgi:transmembrane protein EpsG
MSIYFFTSILAYLFMLFSRLINGKNNIIGKAFAFISFLILWVISGIRYGVGTDFYDYYTYLSRIDIVDIRNNEFGIWLLGSIVNNFTNDGQMFIFITSFIITFFIFYTIYKNSAYPEVSILLFFGLGMYFTSLNIIRQYLAISIVFYSINFLFNKKIFIYIISVLIATMFHFSAIIALVFIVITKLRKSPLMSRLSIFLALMSVLLFYDKVLVFFIPDQYNDYVNTRYINEGSNYIFFILYLLITIVLHIFRKQLIILDSKNEYYLILLFIGMGITLLGTQSLIINRFANYFTVISILVLVDLIKIVKEKNLRVITYLGLVSISLLGMYLFMNRNLGGVLPYKTFLMNT